MSARPPFPAGIAPRLARVVTELITRRPVLWPLFRTATKLEFDRLARRWDVGRNAAHLASFEAALEAVPADPRRALDLGTGTGAGAFAMARRFPAAEVVGVDLSPAMVERAREKLPPEVAGRVRFEQADGAALPFPDGFFDVVGLANMIPFFDEVARIVAPGGWVVIGFSIGPNTPIYVPAERLRRELSERGFRDIREVAAGPGTALLARKSSEE